jgi:hypothetical protein
MSSRKLSQLQQQILRLALANKGQLSNRQALCEIYGFPTSDHTAPGVFSPAEVGIKRYRSATAAVVKSFNRIADRGLADRVYNFGIYLTKAGIEAARTIKQQEEV